jgi:hypothetical protein
MKTRLASINIYLCLLAFLFIWGCGTTGFGGKKEATQLRVHVERPRDASGRSVEAIFHRENPVVLVVDKQWILNEGDVTKAEVVESHGAYDIKLELTRHGKLVLDITSTANRGKRLAMFSSFGDSRWIGVMPLEGAITNGVITFTPDSTRAEADRIVRGLNNIAKEIKKNPDF